MIRGINKLCLLAGILLCFTIIGQQKTTQAADGYPYASTPCVHAPYSSNGSGANWCSGFEWGTSANSTANASVLSPYGYYYRNCTDYVAWRVHSSGVSPTQYRGLGNAKQWITPSAAHGLRVDAMPLAGSAAVRTGGVWGHVAFVEETYPNGQIRISQYNNGADGNYSEQIGTPAALGFSHFVHFEDYMPSASPPVESAPEPAAPIDTPIPAEQPDLAEPAQDDQSITPASVTTDVSAEDAAITVASATAITPATETIGATVPEPSTPPDTLLTEPDHETPVLLNATVPVPSSATMQSKTPVITSKSSATSASKSPLATTTTTTVGVTRDPDTPAPPGSRVTLATNQRSQTPSDSTPSPFALMLAQQHLWGMAACIVLRENLSQLAWLKHRFGHPLA